MIESNSEDGYEADVCLIVEGAYPFITGGVSSWLQDLVVAQSHLSFYLIALSADSTPKEIKYELPPNIVGMHEVSLQNKELRVSKKRGNNLPVVQRLEAPLIRLMEKGALADLVEILTVLGSGGSMVVRSDLLNSEAAFGMIERMYERSAPRLSFLNYFWSWRVLVGGVLSVIFGKIPKAKVYHALSTGYAGLLMARAVVETGRPGLLTEHGIYTNERRIEIAMADWLRDDVPVSLNADAEDWDLRDIWIKAFSAQARCCYEACSRIVTLYEGNQLLQLRDGAPAERLEIIPNGINYGAYSQIPRDSASRRPTVALIGRVVPIKDIKTFIRAAMHLRHMVPDVQVLILGPTDEDLKYFGECKELVIQFELGDCINFCGKVRLQDYLGAVDVVALTSLSEAQPLVLLEAGAAGIPSVATDVGACREIVLGRPDEDPPLGPGGVVTPLSSSVEIAKAITKLLLNDEFRFACSKAIQRRAEKYYNRNVIDKRYTDLYQQHICVPDFSGPIAGAAWLE